MEKERKMAKERKKMSGQRWKEEKRGRREIESEPPSHKATKRKASLLFD